MINLQESFQSGTAGHILGKFLRVLGKKTHKQFLLSPIKNDYISPEGKFSAFFAMFNHGKKSLRINFRLNKSDEIYSIDYFSKPSKFPTKTIYLDGFNIVQIINTVALVITNQYEEEEDYPLDESRMIERVPFATEGFMQWVNKTNSINALREQPLTKLFPMFVTWCKENDIKSCSYSVFASLTKNYIKDNQSIITQNIFVGKVEDADRVKERLLGKSSDEESFSEIKDEADDYMKKSEMMEYYLKLIANKDAKDVNGLFIAGKAGVGKSAGVVPILKSLGVSFRKYTGGLRGATALYQLVWLHSSTDPVDVIILDDNDGILNSQTGVNLLKGIMDSNEVREIAYVKSSDHDENFSKSANLKEADFVNDEDPMGLEVEPVIRTKAPSKFIVKPKIIFISNLPKIPEAIASKCLYVTINYDKNQMLDILEANLDSILDPQKLQDKWLHVQGINFKPRTKEGALEVLQYLRKLNVESDKIDFRQMKFALTIWQGCEGPEWRTWVRMHFRRI